jgi:hypothetical protein
MVAERDEWLLRRETRIASLEKIGEFCGDKFAFAVFRAS